MSYPEHEKLKEIQPKSQAIHEFLLEFLQDKGIFLANYMLDEDGEKTDIIVPVYKNLSELVAEFYEIDLNVIENEKRAMLDEIRKANEKRDMMNDIRSHNRGSSQ